MARIADIARLAAPALAALLLGPPAPALAQDRIPSHCLAFAAAPGFTLVQNVSPDAPDTVRLRFIDHAMFLVATPGVTAVTDYSGFIGTGGLVPDVVTMNNAHRTHWTPAPDPAIPHVLQGWSSAPDGAEHYLDLGEMLVRNVPTDTRGMGGVRPNGNSIFVFEAAGLCIGHLGHLHHVPTPEQFAMLGRLDVVMVPVDGGYTLPVADAVATLRRLRSSVVLPMHWFTEARLERFLSDMAEAGFDIDRDPGTELVLGLENLPPRPTVKLLRPAFLN